MQISSRRLARNALWNLLGAIAPVPAALVAIPRLVEEMGVARFGVLTLAWMVVGYFSLFDMGIGRALTRLVAARVGTDRATEASAIVWTANTLMAGLGVVGGLLMAVLTPYLVTHVLKVPPGLLSETTTSLWLLSASIPVVILTAGCRGLMEGHQHFGVANAIRAPAGALAYLAPLAVLPFSNSLEPIVLALVLVRALSWVAHVVLCRRLYPEFRRIRRYDPAFASALLRFGGWLTVSSVVGPMLLYLGRFVIAAVISAEAVAFFVVPYEIIAQFLVIPAVLVAVLFPVFSQIGEKDTIAVSRTYCGALIAVSATMIPLVALSISLAEPGIAFWINEDFAAKSFRVAQFLSLGVFINSIGLISQVVVQASGHPDWTAKLHLVELLLYVPYLLYLTDTFGIEGAAVAWVVRVAISTLVLLYLARRVIDRPVENFAWFRIR